MANEPSTVAQLLLEHADPVLDYYFEDPARCLIATRTAVELGKMMRVEVRPVTAQLIALNPQAAEEMDAGMPPEERRGYMIGIAYRPGLDKMGHLVAHLPASNEFVDLAVGQMARPEHDITVPKVLRFTSPWKRWLDTEDGRLAVSLEHESGTRLLYSHEPRMTAYQHTYSDWQKVELARQMAWQILQRVLD